MDIPKRVAVIGLDCALTHLIEQHIKEGYLPTFKKLFEKGVVCENAFAPFPTVTPPNWTTIATGASAGTHCVTDFHVHEPGTDLDNSNVVQAFNSERSRAEFVWDALDQDGKKCIVLNYPGAWPSHMKNGVMIGGAGLSLGEYRDGLWGLDSRVNVCHEQLVSTDVYPYAIRGEFDEAEEWHKVPDMGDDPLEMEFKLSFPNAYEETAPTTWYLLIRDPNGEGYTHASLAPRKDFSQAFCTLTVGEWSDKIFTTIQMADGSERKVFFRCKLLELSDDAEDFRFLISNICSATGWSNPPELAEKISDTSKGGTFSSGGGLRGYSTGWYDLQTYIEINEQYSEFLADAAITALDDNDWDLFMMHSHPTDWVYHAIMNDMSPATCQDEEKRKKNWEAHLKIYETQDRMLERLLEECGDETLVVLISDHGATPDGPMINPYDILVPAGLCAQPETWDSGKGYVGKVLKTLAAKPDPKTSKAIPQREIYIYVNLKGRDPNGIVDPEDYEKVQEEIIEALYAYREPTTGKRPIALALKKQDARILGLYGDHVGDVIYALYPEFGSQHGQILPAAEWGMGSLKVLFTMTGPGMKRGYRLKRNCWLADLVPTICYLMNWPLPKQAEGAIIYQAFEDPNFKYREIADYQKQIAQLEKEMGL